MERVTTRAITVKAITKVTAMDTTKAITKKATVKAIATDTTRVITKAASHTTQAKEYCAIAMGFVETINLK